MIWEEKCALSVGARKLWDANEIYVTWWGMELLGNGVVLVAGSAVHLHFHHQLIRAKIGTDAKNPLPRSR